MQIVNAVKNLITDVNITVTTDSLDENGLQCDGGMTIQSMDLSHVSLVRAVISEAAFHTFGIKGRTCQIGMNLNNLSKVLACAHDDDRVVMLYREGCLPGDSWVHMHMYSCGDDTTGSLISLRGNSVAPHMSRKDPVREKYFKFPSMFVDEVVIGIPPYPCICTMAMPSKLLFDITEDLGAFSDTLDISLYESTKPRGYVVSYSSMYASESGGKHDIFAANNGGEMFVQVHERPQGHTSASEPIISLSFASKYLQSFAQSYHVSDNVLIHIRDDAPIEVVYKDQDALIAYHLAPRMAD